MSNTLPISAGPAAHVFADEAIVVTGMGAIGPFGTTVEALWSALCDGRALFIAQPDGPQDDLCGFSSAGRHRHACSRGQPGRAPLRLAARPSAPPTPPSPRRA